MRHSLAHMEADVKLALVFGSLLAMTGCATAVGGNTSENNEDAAPPKTDAGASDALVKKVPPEASTPQNDSGSTSDDDGSTPATDSTCAGESTQSTCEQCCLSVHPTGYNTYFQALQTCACTSPGVCATDCATEACAGNPTTPGDACDTCMNGALTQGTGACYTAVDTACTGDPDCTDLFMTCIPPCESK